VALAPTETYDAVEITVFDHPVARGRIQVRDEFAAAGFQESGWTNAGRLLSFEKGMTTASDA
jgi:hypothetical protein